MTICRGLGFALLVALLYLSLIMVVPDGWAIVKFLAYVLAFNALPGLAVMMLAAPRAFSPGCLLLLAWVSGLAVNMLLVTLLWLCGALALLSLLPLMGAAGLFLALRHNPLPLPSLAPAALAVSFLCGTPVLTLAHVMAGDPWGGFSFHSAFQGVFIRGLEQGWPPPNLMLPDVPLAYNYLAHLWVLGAAKVTALPLDLLVARLAPVFLGGTAAAALLVAGRLMLDLRWWIAAVPVICLFWVPGIPPVSAGLFATFMPFGANLILSPYPAMVLFIGTLLFLLSDRPATGPWRFLILATLAFLTTGARGVTPPILLCALALHIAVVWYVTARIRRRDASDLVAITVGFAAGLVLFFRVTSEFTGAGFVQVNGHPFAFLVRPDQYLFTLPHWLMRQGVHATLAAGLAFLVIAIFHGGFLAPAVPAAFGGSHGRDHKALTLLAGGASAGVSAFFFTEAPGYSHVSFLYYSAACLALLGAGGLQRLLDVPRNPHLRLVSLAAVLALAGLRASELPGPAVSWLLSRTLELAGGQLHGTASSVPPVITCLRSGDSELFGHLRQERDPVVIFLPSNATSSRYCEALWLLVDTPVQSISSYALTYVPGTGDSRVAALLAKRARDMYAALASASGGHLAVQELLRLRRSLDPARPVLVLADDALVPDFPEQVVLVARNDRFRLWRLGD